MKKFATLTIGQAPRPDLAPVFNAIAQKWCTPDVSTD